MMELSIHASLEDIPPEHWNALVDADNPFARHEFLIALERHQAVGEKFGWLPQYITAYENGTLLGAAPMYLKDNSYGEFVFDWDWAEAWHRSGLEYYPKLVVAIPYTPATGARLLLREANDQTIATALIDFATAHARRLNVSSLHWLFTDATDTQRFRDHPDYMLRLGCQFHWQNQNYKDFDDYLSCLTSKKRKQIQRERRQVREQHIELEVLHGNEISEEQWRIFHGFYCSTFDKKSGYATLSLDFFLEISRTMPANIVLVMAKHQGEYVAGAFNIRGEKTLYGRHWGCCEDFHSLHFEACYYQGLAYCITHGLQRFEPGAQGEHKISRGFLPTPTWSAHWIAHPQFREAIDQFLQRETAGMQHYIEELSGHSPFKTA